MKHGMILVIAVFLLNPAWAGDGETEAFEKALEQHLSALRAKDFPAFSKTLAPENLTLVLPNGKKSDTTEAFLSMHREWFKDPNWTMSHQILTTRRNGNMAFALTRSEYREKERDGKPYVNIMHVSRVFEKIDGAWLMVYDQATSIKDP